MPCSTERGVARDLRRGLGPHGLDAYAAACGRGLEPAALLADRRVLGAVVEHHEEGAQVGGRIAGVGERVGEDVARAGRLEDGHEVLGVTGERRAA